MRRTNPSLQPKNKRLLCITNDQFGILTSCLDNGVSLRFRIGHGYKFHFFLLFSRAVHIRFSDTKHLTYTYDQYESHVVSQIIHTGREMPRKSAYLSPGLSSPLSSRLATPPRRLGESSPAQRIAAISCRRIPLPVFTHNSKSIPTSRNKFTHLTISRRTGVAGKRARKDVPSSYGSHVPRNRDPRFIRISRNLISLRTESK